MGVIMNHCKQFLYSIVVIISLLYLACHVFAGQTCLNHLCCENESCKYDDVPQYNQDWFNGICTRDCAPTSAAMVLGWYDSHGWPRMVHGGSNNFDQNHLGVQNLAHYLSLSMGYICYLPVLPINPNFASIRVIKLKY